MPRTKPAATAGRTSPAALVVERFGKHGITVPEVAAICEVNKSTIYHWLRDKKPRLTPQTGGKPGASRHLGSYGSGGIIPAKYHRVLVDAARDRGIRLTPREVVYGR